MRAPRMSRGAAADKYVTSPYAGTNRIRLPGSFLANLSAATRLPPVIAATMRRRGLPRKCLEFDEIVVHPLFHGYGIYRFRDAAPPAPAARSARRADGGRCSRAKPRDHLQEIVAGRGDRRARHQVRRRVGA